MKFPFTKELILVGLFSLVFVSPAAFGKVDPAGNLNVDQSFALIVKVNNNIPNAKVNLTFGIDDKGRKTTHHRRDGCIRPAACNGRGRVKKLSRRSILRWLGLASAAAVPLQIFGSATVALPATDTDHLLGTLVRVNNTTGRIVKVSRSTEQGVDTIHLTIGDELHEWINMPKINFRRTA